MGLADPPVSNAARKVGERRAQKEKRTRTGCCAESLMFSSPRRAASLCLLTQTYKHTPCV